MDSGLCIRDLRVKQGAFQLSLPELDVPAGEVFILLGPSGAGKTVFLETLAGFHPADAGSMRLFGRELAGMPVERRKVAVIFQDYALFPHMTVRQNILYGARRGRVADPIEKMDRLVSMMSLNALLDKPAPALSGGEKQRVGLARALMLDPELLLFDEPLSSLDPSLRDRLRDELKGILKEIRQTTVYVTHDRGEAFVLGDRVGVLEKGELLQAGAPDELFHRPRSERTARWVGIENLIAGEVASVDGAGARVNIGADTITAAAGPPAAAPVTVCLHSDAVFLSRGGRTDGHGNRLRGRVSRVAALGYLTKVHLDCRGYELIASVTRGTAEDLGVQVGLELDADFRPGAVHLIAR